MSPRFFLILEAKNIIGKLTLNHGLWQMTREIDGRTDVFDDPLLQAERLEDQFQKWLDHHIIVPDYPSESRVVITSPAQLQIEGSNDPSHAKIIRKAFLGKELDRIIKNHTKTFIHHSNLRDIGNQLLASHRPLIIDLFSSMKSLFPENIIKGVQCPNCSHFHMIRKKRNWYCDQCGHFSKNAHLAALRDYFLIFGPAITNKQCRDFLMLESSAVAKHIFSSVSSHYEGENKGRVYHLSLDLLNNKDTMNIDIFS
ncbi:nuclease-related domain-containing protein [Sporolactobacillus shoreae]|uniref:nuclease-related domain-containing protein n=1 Tax=Sporolactobacillus shoreae TaxID=1465501 RepID=UPI001F4F602A|nr:nuclease-related domain-containing protein [Sporolactobacillus shoreae]